MIEENLSKLGFSPSEIKIYLHLIEFGSSYPKKISAETRINRTNVYEALDRLLNKGVVSSILKNNIKWFEAKNPKSLISLMEEKEEEISNTKKQLVREIGELKINENKKSLEANIFTGKKGLRLLFEEILDIGEPVYFFASRLQFQKLFGPYFELWHKKRISKKIPQKSIFPRSLKNKLIKRNLLEYSFVEDGYANPTTTIIYGDNCLFIQWFEEPLAIRIQNKDIAKSHLNYFNGLWKQAKV